MKGPTSLSLAAAGETGLAADIAHLPCPQPVRAASGRLDAAMPEIVFRKCASVPGARYFLGTPAVGTGHSRVLVTVHGISFNAWEHVQIFGRYCSLLNLTVVAPLFLPKCVPRFQRFGHGRKGRHIRSDLALNAILDEVTTITGVSTDRIYLFGFSGGGQFVHRYAMAYPERVIAATMGAPGWYSLPSADSPFPYGIGPAPGRDYPRFEPERFLHVPMAVFVGSRDGLRDESLNTSNRLDREQGLTRRERGRRWIAAMTEAARQYGLDTQYRYHELAGCGHSFADCIERHNLDLQALEFLLHAAASEKPGRRRSGPLVPFII